MGAPRDRREVDFLLGCVTVRRGKGGAERTIPMDPTLREALTDWCLLRGHGPGAMVLGRDSPRLNRKAIGRLLDRLCLEARVPPFTAHALRHTFGTEGASAGISATELQSLMGHEDLSTTQRTRCDASVPAGLMPIHIRRHAKMTSLRKRPADSRLAAEERHCPKCALC